MMPAIQDEAPQVSDANKKARTEHPAPAEAPIDLPAQASPALPPLPALPAVPALSVPAVLPLPPAAEEAPAEMPSASLASGDQTLPPTSVDPAPPPTSGAEMEDVKDKDVKMADAEQVSPEQEKTLPQGNDEEMKDVSAQAAEIIKKRHAAMHRMHAGLQGKSPVEQFEVFCTKHALLARVEGLKNCHTTLTLEADSDFLENPISLVKQLATSVNKLAKDMLKVVNEHQKTKDADKQKTQT